MTDNPAYFPASAAARLTRLCAAPAAGVAHVCVAHVCVARIAHAEGGARPVFLSAQTVRLAGVDQDHRDDDGEQALLEKPRLKKSPLYKVVLINDDYTPMEFVVQVLEIFFKMNREQATQIMLTVHTQGKGVCGIYTKDIAETKAAQVNQYARDHQHPLLCEIEASEG